VSQSEQQQVPENYKQTEVGVIPEDWNINPLGSIGKFKNGINKDGASFGHGSPLVNLMDVFGKTSIGSLENLGLIDSSELDKKEYALKKGDVLFIRSSVKPSGVGLTAVVKGNLEGAVYSGFLIRFRSDEELSTVFKEYCFYDSNFRKRIIAASSVSANTNVNQDNLKKLLLAYPQSKKEQTAISDALSDVDGLIGSLEKLIVKKRAIKTAAMQQLLTGKKRLPPFDQTHTGYKQTDLGEIPNDWEVDSIGRVLSITTGDKNTQDKVGDGQYPFFVRSQKIERINSYSFDGEAVLTAGDGVGTGKIFHYINGKFDYHQRVYLMHNFCNRLNSYYFYIYFSNNFYDRIMSMTAKSSVDSVRREMIADMKIVMPPINEQIEISKALTDMEQEIVLLEQCLNKTQQIKQGMMQELLTGRTRLI